MNTCSMLTWLLAPAWLTISLSTFASPTGPEIAQLLNNRYRSTAATCAAGKPAWHCNGVLVQTTTRPAGQSFWQHDSNATVLGAEGLGYLRQDLGIRQLPVSHGAVFSDLYTAVGSGKTLDVLCSYPFTQELNASRGGSGCALPTARQPALTDLSSCAALGVTNHTGWLAHFQQSGNQPARQCSLSAQDPGQFAASLKAHEGLGSEWSARLNRLQVANWDANTPRNVPVEALFYIKNQGATLIAAQQDQRDYFNATGQWLPVLRLDLNDASRQVFGFSLQDQLYIGYQVASAMNRRYSDTRTACANGLSAYFCDGVLIRAAQASNSFHAWDPSPNSVVRNGVSFSYLRADVGTTQLAGTGGFTFKESSAPALHPITLRCAYPMNAGTSAIPDSCRTRCAQQGITTVEAWRTRYGSNPASSCAFTADAAQFQLSVQVRTVLSASNRAAWNEIIIAAWPQGIPALLPLEAFFYTTAASRPHAQFMQRDYSNSVGAFLPVIQMTLTQPQPFAYNPADQLAAGSPGRITREESDMAEGNAPAR